MFADSGVCESAVGKLFETHFIIWIENHGIALNVAKTESMVIASKPKLTRLQGQRIQITHNGTAIKSVDSHKLLCSKVLKRINLLIAIKTYLPQCTSVILQITNPTYC